MRETELGQRPGKVHTPEKAPVASFRRFSWRYWFALWPTRIVAGGLAGLFFLFLGIPLVSLLLREAPGAVWASLLEPDVGQALQLSVVTTTLSTLLAIVFGLPVAYVLARLSFPGRGVRFAAYLWKNRPARSLSRSAWYQPPVYDGSGSDGAGVCFRAILREQCEGGPGATGPALDRKSTRLN